MGEIPVATIVAKLSLIGPALRFNHTSFSMSLTYKED